MSESQRKIIVIGAGAAVVGAGPLLTAGGAQAAGFEVTNLNESGPGSLRQAIIDSNALAGPDVITFQAGLTGTITLSTGHLQLADSVTITGPGAASLTIDANRTSRIFYLYNPTSTIDVVISGLTLTGGQAADGGAILDNGENLVLDSVVLDDNIVTGGDGGALRADGSMALTVRDSVISGNTAVDGGGIYVEDTGAALLIESTVISGNTASGNGGGVYFYDPDFAVTISEATISGNTAAGRGGGIYLYDTDGSEPLLIDRTTISGNTAGDGGGIFFYEPDTPVTIRNSTISGNAAVNRGGGIYLYDASSPVNIEHSTIAGNTSNDSGNLFLLNAAPVLSHTAVADGVATLSPDITAGQTLDANYSLIEDVTGLTLNGANNITGTDPALGALADNGGPTFTQMPAAGSALIGAGDPAIVAAPPTDQRGAARIFGTTIDIGAVEVAVAPVNDAGATTEDIALNVAVSGVLANDPGATTAQLVTGPANGVVILNADGSYQYTPNANFNGVDSFTYEAFSGLLSLGVATVNLTISAMPDPPIAVNDTAAVTVGGTVTIQVRSNDSDPDGDPITITAVTQGAQGTVTIVDGAVVYSPNLNASGTDTFTYTISDGVNVASATVTVTLTVVPIIAPVVTPPPAIIPATGFEHGGQLLLGAGLVIAGGALTAASRRRGTMAP